MQDPEPMLGQVKSLTRGEILRLLWLIAAVEYLVAMIAILGFGVSTGFLAASLGCMFGSQLGLGVLWSKLHPKRDERSQKRGEITDSR